VGVVVVMVVVEDMKCNVMNISKGRKYVAMGTKFVNTV
jgi:hypothetical protein